MLVGSVIYIFRMQKNQRTLALKSPERLASTFCPFPPP